MYCFFLFLFLFPILIAKSSYRSSKEKSIICNTMTFHWYLKNYTNCPWENHHSNHIQGFKFLCSPSWYTFKSQLPTIIFNWVCFFYLALLVCIGISHIKLNHYLESPFKGHSKYLFLSFNLYISFLVCIFLFLIFCLTSSLSISLSLLAYPCFLVHIFIGLVIISICKNSLHSKEGLDLSFLHTCWHESCLWYMIQVINLFYHNFAKSLHFWFFRSLLTVIVGQYVFLFLFVNCPCFPLLFHLPNS